MIVFFAALNEVAPTRAYFEVQNILLNKLLEYTMNNSSSKAYSGAFCGEASIIYTYLVLYKISNEEKYIKYAKKTIMQAIPSYKNISDICMVPVKEIIQLISVFKLFFIPIFIR